MDTSLTEAFLILERFGERLAQVHLSEVATSARHGRLSRAAILAFRKLAPLIPADVPVILESPPLAAYLYLPRAAVPETVDG